MTVQYKELYRVWSLRLSISTALIVLLLSWINQIKLIDLILRSGVSFALIYFLTIGTLNLFEKAAPPTKDEDQSADESGCGKTIDFSVGDEGTEDAPESQDDGFPGQVNRDLKAGLPNIEKQAEIVKRMGWQ